MKKTGIVDRQMFAVGSKQEHETINYQVFVSFVLSTLLVIKNLSWFLTSPDRQGCLIAIIMFLIAFGIFLFNIKIGETNVS